MGHPTLYLIIRILTQGQVWGPASLLGAATSLPMEMGPGGLQATVWLSFLRP